MVIFANPRLLCSEIVKKINKGMPGRDHARAFVILHKYYCENVRKFVQNNERFSLDFSVALWYNIRARGGDEQPRRAQSRACLMKSGLLKKFFKNF